MKPRANKLIEKLQIGWYLVRVDEFGRAAALPITSKESAAFMRDIIGRKK